MVSLQAQRPSSRMIPGRPVTEERCFSRRLRAIVDRPFFRRHGGEVSPPRTPPLAKPAENNSARDFAAIVFFGFRRTGELSHHDIFTIEVS
jgi:hypothetical protein